jgi:hypothetical protein
MKNILIVDSNFYRLYVDDNYLFGGKDIQLKAWSDHFLERGYCVHAIARNPDSSVDCVKLLNDGYLSLLLKFILTRYDIVIFREFSSKLVFLPVLKMLRINTVFMVSSDAFFQTNRLEYLSRSSISKWKVHLYNQSLRLFKLYTLQTIKQVSLFTKSIYFKNEYILLPNLLPGIGLKSIEKNFDFVWIGNIREVKQPLFFADMASAMPHLSFGLFGSVIDDAIYKKLRQREMELENFVIIIDIPRGQILDMLSRSIALVNTSSLEGFPNTFLEAWCLNVPVISFVNPDMVVTTNLLGEVCGEVCELVSAAQGLVDNPIKLELFKNKIATYIQRRKLQEEEHVTKFIMKCT